MYLHDGSGSICCNYSIVLNVACTYYAVVANTTSDVVCMSSEVLTIKYLLYHHCMVQDLHM